MLRVVADTNIYVSALIFGGLPLRLLEMAVSGEIRLVISEPILEELREVLQRKFRLSGDRFDQAIAYVTGCADLVAPSERLTVVADDPDDNRILECAMAGFADFIVSGDGHLLRLDRFDGRPIVRVADFLRIVENADFS